MKINNWLKFTPLLLLYAGVILIFQSDKFRADEWRYVMYATNLSHGSYLPNYTVYLWTGPGYPVLLTPFIFFKTPLLIPKLVNAVFLFLAVLCFYKTLLIYMKEQQAMLFAYLFGLYPPFMRWLHLLHTEIVVIFLVCAFLFCVCKLYQAERRSGGLLFITSALLAYLALTKIFFGYVILTGLLLYLGLYLRKRKDTFKKTLQIYLIAFLLCLPYLFYTYSLTGKIFYWGNSGGENLYWMSTPYENELGDWISPGDVMNNEQLFKKHGVFFNNFSTLSVTERDDALKKKAMENIINNPSKFMKNWLANIGRLLFSYPYSYNPQKLSTYYYIVPNMFLVVFSFICIYPTVKGRRLIPYEMYFLLLFGGMSFLGTSLLSAYNRMSFPIVPILALWISFTVTNILKIEIRR